MEIFKYAYEIFMRNGDRNIFEEVIDKLMIDKYSDSPEIKEYINSLPLEKKRMAILVLLGGDNNLWTRIKALTNNSIDRLEHVKDIILMLRQYVKIGEIEKEKYGEVMTPLELIKDMLAQFPKEVWSNPHLKWLDPANGTGPYPMMIIYKLMIGLQEWEPDPEKRYRHIVENMIYVCEVQPKNMFLYMCAADPFDRYRLNIYTGSFLNENKEEFGFDKHMKEIWGIEEFDIVIANPPYKSYMHLKFLNKSVDLTKDGGYISYVHPSQPFLDIKPKRATGEETEAIEKVQKYDASMTLINGNLLFNEKMFFTPLSITFIKKQERTGPFVVDDKTKGERYEYPSISEVNLLGYSEEYKSLKEKIFDSVEKNGHINMIGKREGRFYVGLSEIRGNICEKNMIKADFYTLLPQDSPISEKPKSKHYNAGFQTFEEAKNFKSYLRTKFARFCLSLYKINSTLAGTSSVLNAVPILDFSVEHDDISLREMFDISDSEWRFIESIIPDFYIDGQD